MFIATVMNNGEKFFLRNTVWAFHADRATQFESEDAARAALVKAKPFMRAATFKAARIEPVTA